MPKRLATILFSKNISEIDEYCEKRGLNELESEIIRRIYWQHQSLNYIADTMEFDKYGKPQKYYSVRTLNNIHKEAVLKLAKLK